MDGLIFGGSYVRRDWASLIVGRKFTVFPCLTLYYRTISKYKPPPPPGRAYIWRGDLTEGFLRYEFGGLIFGGYSWRGLFSEIYGIPYNAALDYLYTYKFSNVKVLAKVSPAFNNMGSCSGKEKLVESKTRYQIFLCLLSSRLLFLFPQYRVVQYAL